MMACHGTLECCCETCADARKKRIDLALLEETKERQAREYMQKIALRSMYIALPRGIVGALAESLREMIEMMATPFGRGPTTAQRTEARTVVVDAFLVPSFWSHPTDHHEGRRQADARDGQLFCVHEDRIKQRVILERKREGWRELTMTRRMRNIGPLPRAYEAADIDGPTVDDFDRIIGKEPLPFFSTPIGPPSGDYSNLPRMSTPLSLPRMSTSLTDAGLAAWGRGRMVETESVERQPVFSSGSGRIGFTPARAIVPPRVYEALQRLNCEACEGTGRYGVADDDVCQYCNGSGLTT